THHSEVRRPPAGVFPATRGNERRRLGADRVREPGRLRVVPCPFEGRRRGVQELRHGSSASADPQGGTNLRRGGGGNAWRSAMARGGCGMIAVIFEVLPHADRKQDYLDAASALRPHLDGIDGFLSIERLESESLAAYESYRAHLKVDEEACRNFVDLQT